MYSYVVYLGSEIPTEKDDMPSKWGVGSTLKMPIPPKIPKLALAFLAFFSLNVKNCLFLLKKDVNEIVLLLNT